MPQRKQVAKLYFLAKLEGIPFTPYRELLAKPE